MVSIIMPCYNASKYIDQAIESVLKQDFSDWELIIVDDGSTDNSVDIINSYEDDRIILCRQSHLGACVARNKGVDVSRGEYLKFLDADDIMHYKCISTQYEQILGMQSHQIPFGDYSNIDEDGNVISEFSFSAHPNMLHILMDDQPFFFFSYWQVLISCPLLRKSNFMNCGGYDINLKRGQESDFHFRLALSGVEFIYCPCKTFSYREYDSHDRITSNGRNSIDMMNEYWHQITIKYEKILLEHYKSIPRKYLSYFSNYWFNKAREKFADGNIVEGRTCLLKAYKFNYTTRFMRLYKLLGMILGYIFVEKVLRYRLRMLSKV